LNPTTKKAAFPLAYISSDPAASFSNYSPTMMSPAIRRIILAPFSVFWTSQTKKSLFWSKKSRSSWASDSETSSKSLSQSIYFATPRLKRISHSKSPCSSSTSRSFLNKACTFPTLTTSINHSILSIPQKLKPNPPQALALTGPSNFKKTWLNAIKCGESLWSKATSIVSKWS
jgi:hypothetical protein